MSLLPRKCTLAALLVLLAATSLTAQGAGTAETTAALKRFLLSPVRGTPDPRGDLVALFEDVAAVTAALADLRSAPMAGPGFHMIRSADKKAHVIGAMVIPADSGSPGPRPVLVVSEPARISEPPGELPLRALYGAYLDQGWVILAPTVSPFALVPEARPDLASLLAAAALRCSLDRERVLLVSPIADRLDPITPLLSPYIGETTLFAAYQDILAGTTLPARGLDLDSWRGRLIALHLSEHNPDEALLWRNRLRDREQRGLLTLWYRRDASLNFRGRLRLEPEVVRDLVSRIKRAPPAPRLRFIAGGSGSRRHEWAEVPNLDAPLRILAEQKPDAIHLITPDVPAREPFIANLYFAHQQEVAVFLNDHPLRPESSTPPVVAALLLARYQLQTGRKAAGVIRIRP